VFFLTKEIQVARHSSTRLDASDWSAIIWLAVFIMGLIGWVMNIVHVFNATAVTGKVVVQVIGILCAPLGAVLGWIQ
jgi:ABC-type siderophore export system fused ATPase/permease subunit